MIKSVSVTNSVYVYLWKNFPSHAQVYQSLFFVDNITTARFTTSELDI